LGLIRNLVGRIGEGFIYFLIWVFGRKVKPEEVPWLAGPFGSELIGDRPYDEYARKEGLTVTRNSSEGGLIPSFDVLAGPTFDASAVDPLVRHFYQETARYRMDVWARLRFPASLGLWLLVTTISRRVDQLNFPVDTLETALGMESEILLLRDAEGEVRSTGWFRRLTGTQRVLYTGFYMTEKVPAHPSPCVKVVFPMPNGNATVLLRPEIAEDGSFLLDSSGKGFGDVGFYRIQQASGGRWRVWKVRTLDETFRLFRDADGVLRCDHGVRFLGLPVLHLHYRISGKDP